MPGSMEQTVRPGFDLAEIIGRDIPNQNLGARSVPLTLAFVILWPPLLEAVSLETKISSITAIQPIPFLIL